MGTSRLRSGALTAAVIGWAVAPIALIVALTLIWGTPRLSGDAAPVLAPVRALTAAAQSPVQIGLAWSSGASVSAPAWSGVVQRVFVKPGDVLKAGEPVVQIDGVTRLALGSDAPLFRPLSSGDRGSDVAALNAFLAGRGLPAGSADVFTWQTANGVRSLAAELGVAGWVSQADPTWFVWLPSSTYEVAQVALVPGFPAPSAGEEILTAESRLVGASPVVEGSLDSDSEKPLTATDLESAAIPLAPGSLVVAGETIDVSEDRTAVTPDALQALAALAGDEQRVIAGTLMLDTADGSVLVPTASIVDTQTGQCVVVQKGSNFVSVKVQIVADIDGQTVVQGKLTSKDRVLVAPEASLRRCA